MTIEHIKLWHERARSNPDLKAFNVQLGCHFEEIAEMLDALSVTPAGYSLVESALISIIKLASGLKEGGITVEIGDRKELLDAIADQIVTGVGVAHCAGLNISEGLRRVNISNWSKFDTDGRPVRNEQGKIMKGERYTPPDLEGLY